MAKGLNKHTPDSDELLKRLNSKDSNGLDDFEKEALEGFDSLDNPELSKHLTDSLNKRIDETYFIQEKSGGNKKGFMYLSLAAGLVLIVGLSIFFVNLMGDKKEVAMEQSAAPETIANEVTQPTDLAPASATEPEKEEAEKNSTKETTTIDTKPGSNFASTGGSGKNMPAESRAQTQPDKDDGLTSRMVVKEPKTSNKAGDLESSDDLKKQETDKLAQQGPPPGNVIAPSVVMDSKTKVMEEGATMDANEKTASKGNVSSSPSSPSNNSLATAKPTKDADKRSEGKARKKEKASGEYLGKEDQVAANDVSTVNGQATGGINNTEAERDENGYKHNIEYSNHAYSKPQDYLKVEINKSEMLKTNVKAFKAELTINEKGTVTAVKFLTPLEPGCTGCKKELEKILLNMPGWKPSASKKAVKETVSYIDQ